MLMLSGRHWDDPITENPRVGSVEVWEIMNLANDLHPIHLHLIQFQLFNRQALNVKAYQKALAQAPLSIPDPAPYLLRQAHGSSPGGSRLEGHCGAYGRHGNPDSDQMGAPNCSLARAGQSQARS